MFLSYFTNNLVYINIINIVFIIIILLSLLLLLTAFIVRT